MRGHILTQELTDLLYCHIARVPNANSKQLRKNGHYVPLSVPKPHAKMHTHIQASIWVFLGLVRCWLSAQVDRRSQRAIRAIMDITPEVLFFSEELLEPNIPVVSEETLARHLQDAKAREELKKMSVRLFLEVLVARVFKKVGLDCLKSDPEAAIAIINRLFERTWAEVESLDYDDTQKTLKALHNDIFRKLCKKWHNEHHLLACMLLADPALESYIACSIRDYIITPKCCTMGRFFSSVGKVISNTFRGLVRCR